MNDQLPVVTGQTPEGATSNRPQQQLTDQKPKEATSVDVEALIKLVDNLELDSYAALLQQVEDACKGKQLTKEEKKAVEKDILRKEQAGRVQPQTKDILRTEQVGRVQPQTTDILRTEQAGRVQPQTKDITRASGGTEPVGSSKSYPVELPVSYTLIRNLVRIEEHPVYRKALAEWEREVASIESRVERKSKRNEGLKKEIYSVISYYSVFQGVLLTATSQSNYLHCLNVGIPIALSAFASVGTLAHIFPKFQEIRALQKHIDSEADSLKELKERVAALKAKGPEGFRFYDFLVKEKRTSSLRLKSTLCGIRSSFFVPLAVFLFSVVFLIAHPLILCRPGPK